MKSMWSTVAVALTLSLATGVKAAVVTFNLAGTSSAYTGLGSTGKTFTVSGETIVIYGKTVSNNSNSPAQGPGNPGTLTGDLDLFAVTNGMNGNIASGIAPYVSSQGGTSQTSLQSQLGITEADILLVKLDSSIALNSTVTFLLQAAVSGDQFNVWTGNFTATPTNLGLGGSTGLTEVAAAVNVNVGSNPWSGSYTITKTTAGTEWVAIQADCTYMLLDTISVTPPSGGQSTPEPRFYGLLLISMLGLVSIARRRLASQV